MGANPKVSVLMSVFNGEATIERSINSLLNQKFIDFELIIINDGSTDNTRQILEAYSDERLKMFNLEHVGLTPALNFGLEQCKGAYIARMDADDWSHPDRLQLQSALLDRDISTGVVSSLVEYEGDETQNTGYALHVRWINTLLSHDTIQKKRFEDSPVANPSCMFRKSLVEKFGNYRPGVLPEDYEFWLRLLDHGVRFRKINQPLLKWSDLPSRITRTLPHYSPEKFHEIKALYLTKWIFKNYAEKPQIYVFGTGKAVKKKSQYLSKYGISVYKFIEVKNPPYGHKNVIHYSSIPAPGIDTLILSYIGDRQGKARVISYLGQCGYAEGVNFLMMA